MSIFEKLFQTRRREKLPDVDLDELMQPVYAEAQILDGEEVDVELLIARMADLCRRAGFAPMSPETLEKACRALDEEGRRRFALCFSAFQELNLEAHLKLAFAGERAAEELLQKGFLETVDATRSVTLALIVQSPLRVEEFARHLLSRLGIAIEGEHPSVSRARLERLDYTSLLKEAGRAHKNAEDRLKYLHKLQEELDQRFAPRGKW